MVSFRHFAKGSFGSFFFLNASLWKTVKTAHLPRMTIWYPWGEQNKCAADSEGNSHEAITNVSSNGRICSKCRHLMRWLGRKFPQREEWLLGRLLINLPHDLIVKLHTILEFQLPENKAYTIDTFSLAHLLKSPGLLDCWAPGFAPQKSYLYLPWDEPLTSKFRHEGGRWTNEDVQGNQFPTTQNVVTLMEDG